MKSIGITTEAGASEMALVRLKCATRPDRATTTTQGQAESDGTAVAVEDEEIVAAMHRTTRTEGIDAAPEGAATLCALLRMIERGEVSSTDHVVLFNCGTGLKHPELRPEA